MCGGCAGKAQLQTECDRTGAGQQLHAYSGSAHCGYPGTFDIQYMVEGEEIFGYEPVAVLKPSGEYNDETDLIFYKEPKQSGAVLLKKGDFAIVPPEDAHAPRRMSANGPCRVKKIVVKVKV